MVSRLPVEGGIEDERERAKQACESWAFTFYNHIVCITNSPGLLFIVEQKHATHKLFDLFTSSA